MINSMVVSDISSYENQNFHAYASADIEDDTFSSILSQTATLNQNKISMNENEENQVQTEKKLTEDMIKTQISEITQTFSNTKTITISDLLKFNLETQALLEELNTLLVKHTQNI